MIELVIAQMIGNMPIKDMKEFTALVTNVYHEAAGEGVHGMAAAGWVVLNRVESWRYPNTISKVIHQPVQFSWTLESHNKPVVIENIIDYRALEDVVQVTAMVYNGMISDPTGGAMWYINPKTVKKVPYWIKDATKIAVINNHEFYTGVK